MRIVLIGSSSERYKGGIAHFTSCLAQELEKHGELLFISWYQLYPPFLTSRDFLDKVSKVSMGLSKAEFLLGYLNPFSWVRAVLKVRRFRPEVIVLAWVHPVHAPVYICMIVMLRLLCRCKIVLQCHNVKPHEAFRGAEFLTRIVCRLVDQIVVHSAAEKSRAEVLCPEGAPIVQLFHPIYEFPLVEYKNKSEGSSKFELLFFGVIRGYKGLDLLLEALAFVIKRTSDVHLTVAGEGFEIEDNGKVIELVKRFNLEEVVTLDLRYIPNEEVGEFFRKTDLVVLPYRSATASGPLSIAYHFGKPVLATRIEGLSELVVDGKSGYLVDVSADAVASGILKYMKNPLDSDDVKEVALKYSWASYAVKLLESA